MNSLDLFMNKILPKLHTFADFYKIDNIYTSKQIGDFFEIITKYIFILHPYYKSFTKNIWLYDEIPYNLFKELNIPEKDKGIDLILFSNDNEYYAIQSKFRNNINNTIPWSDLSTFVGMAFGISNKFDKALYVTNIFNIDEEINKCNRITKIYGDFFDTLDDIFFAQLKEYIGTNNIVTPYKTHIKRNYQVEFINKCDNYFKNNNKGYGNIACGVGKTLMSYWIHKILNPKITLIGVPSLYLLSQFFKEWVFESNADNYNVDFLLVGSDVDFDVDKFKNNSLILTTCESEIYTKLINFINYSTKNLIIITTYQSADKLIFASDVLKITYDFAIIDEAHKTCQQDGHQFSMLLNDKNIKIKKRLFLTATPRIYKTNNINDIDIDVISMNNRKWYGDEIYSYSMRQAIDSGFLCPYQIITLFTENVFIDRFITDNNLIEVNGIKNINSHYIASAIMVIKAFEKNECNHLVTYHNSITNSLLFLNILNMLVKKLNMTVHVIQLDGKTSMSKRNKIIDSFIKYDKCILTTARVLNEGVNIPIIDSVCFVDPRESTIDVTQCIGRSLRLYNSKIMAKVLVPYIINDINEMSNNLYFSKLISVIKSLSDSDETIKEYFKLKIKDKTINKIIRYECYLTNKITINIAEKINIDDWLSELDIEIWKRIDSFEYNYNKLVEWIEINKRYPYYTSEDQIESKLGVWLMHIKRTKKINKLTEYKIKKLEELPEFKWITVIDFDIMYDEVKEWIENNNRYPTSHCNDKKEVKLCHWIDWIKKKKKKNKLNDEHIKKMEKLPNFKWTIVFDYDEIFNEVIEFINTNSKPPSEKSKNTREVQLALWCSRQRQDKRKGKISDDKIKKFNENTLWKWEKEDSFDKKCDDLIDWVTSNKKFPNDMSSDKTERMLGNFLKWNRNQYKKGKLLEKKITKLNNIENWKGYSRDTYESVNDKYIKIKEWVIKNNKLPNTRSENNEEIQIRKLCWELRYKYKNKKLSMDEIKLIESIPNWVWEDESNLLFNQRFKEFENWTIENKRMPSRHSNDPIETSLKCWYNMQKTLLNKNKIKQEDFDKFSQLQYFGIFK